MNQTSLENFKIDKSSWEKVKLGDVVFEPKETMKDMVVEGIQHVVGLEHIESDDMHLRHSASIEESTTFIKKFKKGDVLFGRRRAYLKKAARAEFDGICSGDITVMRARKCLLPELLPFIIHNDKFFDYAVKNSAGGLSPRVKFKDLANFEFMLPPKEQQIKLVDLFLSIDNMLEKEFNLVKKIESQSEVYLNSAFMYGASLSANVANSTYGVIPKNWKLKSLDELGGFKNGINKDKDQFGYGSPFVNLMDIFGFKDLLPKTFDLVNVSDSELRAFNLKKGDVLFVRSSVKPSGVGLTTLVQEDLPETVYSGFIIRFRPYGNEMTHSFRKYCFHERRFRKNLYCKSTISANTNINQESLKKLQIPIPPFEEQIEIDAKMAHYELLINLAKNNLVKSKELQKNLINKLF